MINDYTISDLSMSLSGGLDNCSDTLSVIRQSLLILDEEAIEFESDQIKFAMAVLHKFSSDLDDRLKVLTANAHLIVQKTLED